MSRGRIEIDTSTIPGFASCATPGCADYGQHHPITLIEERTAHYHLDRPTIERETIHRSAADDADLHCATCAGPVSISDSLPPVYENLLRLPPAA